MRTTTLSVSSLVLVAALAGCGDDNNSSPDPDGGLPSKTVTKLVGPAGGTVELANGGKVEIPAGALSSEVMIKVTELEAEDVTPIPGTLEAAGKPIAFEPHGTTFQSEVKVTLPYTGDAAQVRPLKAASETDPTWQTIVGATKNDDGKLQVGTTTFSVYFAARPRRGSGVITLPDGATIIPDGGVDASTGDASTLDGALVDNRCDDNNGGCDPQASCTDDGAETVVCGACPSSYLGDGVTGCTPVLAGLVLSAGTLSPALDETVTSYDVSVDALQQTIALTPTLAAGSTLTIDDEAVSDGQVWTSPVLALGANTITVTTHNGDNSRAYTLLVTRGPGAQQAYVKASLVADSNNFGKHVAIDGNTLVVGAPNESSDASGINGQPTGQSMSSSGAVFVFVRSGNTWTQQAFIKASVIDSYDNFGDSVAISGNTIVVGAPGESSADSGINVDANNNRSGSSGAAYVFVRSGTTWTQQAFIKASNTGDYDNFGDSVSISGNTIVVGAPGESSNAIGIDGNQADDTSYNAGAAYAFFRTGTTWAQQAYLKASNTDAYDVFGSSVSASGNTIVVGAPYESSNAMSINGNQADNSAYYAGAAYVFLRTTGVWAQQAYLKADNADTYDEFGRAVAISSNTIVAGAPGEDSDATGVNGDGTNSNGPDSGAAYVFNRAGATWSQGAYLKASNTELLGNSEGADNFGTSLAIDSNTIVIGAYGEDSTAVGLNASPGTDSGIYEDYGAAYVFTSNAGAWSQLFYVKASNPDTYDGFGEGVAVSGTTFVCGAPGEASIATGINNTNPGQSDNTAEYAGAVYVFR